MDSGEEKCIVLLALNPTMGSALITPLEVLTHGASLVPLKIITATLNGEPIVTRSGFTIEADCGLDAVHDCHGVMVTSCMHYDSGVEPLRDQVVPWLRRQYRSGVLVGALGSGIVTLAMSGVLARQQATAHWSAVSRLQQVFPDIQFAPEYSLLDQNNVFTSSGGYAGEVLSLYFLERLFGREAAERCAAELMLDMDRVRPGRAVDLLPLRRHQDERIHRVQTWLDRHFMEDVNLEWLAQRHHMSLRNFMRRFKDACGETPLGYLQRIRMEEAKRLLDHTSLSVEAIADKVGYQTESHFRRLFKRHTRLTPAQYRTRAAALG